MSLKTDTEAKRKIALLADKARLQLEDCISCLTCAVESSRQDYLLSCAKEYQSCLNGLIRHMERTVPQQTQQVVKSRQAAETVPVSGNGKTDKDGSPSSKANSQPMVESK